MYFNVSRKIILRTGTNTYGIFLALSCVEIVNHDTFINNFVMSFITCVVKALVP